MTTQAPHTVNKAILVGKLAAIQGRNSKGKRVDMTLQEGRSSLGGGLSRFGIELLTPFGEPFVLSLQMATHIQGADVLEALQIGSDIAVEGELRLVASFDSRYARDDLDQGRQTRDLRMDVTCVRMPEPLEPNGVSACWLQGTILEPPRLIRHPEQPSIQMATTVLEVYLERMASARPGYPGLRRLDRQRIEIPIAVSTADSFAGLLYRPGNRLRIEGELARILETQYGEAVREAVAARAQEFEAKKVAAGSAADVDVERRRFRRGVRQLTEQPRTKVVVTYAEAVDEAAQPLSLEEARALRREFQRKLAERRGTATARAITAAHAAKIEVPLPAQDGETTPVAEPRRPRRRSEVVATVDAEEVAPAGELIVTEITNNILID